MTICNKHGTIFLNNIKEAIVTQNNVYILNKDLEVPFSNMEVIFLFDESKQRIAVYSLKEKEVKYLNRKFILSYSVVRTIEDDEQLLKIDNLIFHAKKYALYKLELERANKMQEEELAIIKTLSETLLMESEKIKTQFSLKSGLFSIKDMDTIKTLEILGILKVKKDEAEILFAPKKVLPKSDEELIDAIREFRTDSAPYTVENFKEYLTLVGHCAKYSENTTVLKQQLTKLIGAESLEKKPFSTEKTVPGMDILDDITMVAENIAKSFFDALDDLIGQKK